MIIKKIFSASVMELIGLLIPILVLPLLASKLTSSEMADYLVVTMVLLVCQQVIDYSYTYTTSTWSAEQLKHGFCKVFSSKLILCLCCICFSALLTPLYVANLNICIILAIIFGCLGSLFSAHWLYISTGEYSRFQFINFPAKISVFILALTALDFVGFQWFILLNNMFICFFSVSVLVAKMNKSDVHYYSLQLNEGFKSLLSNYHLFIADFIPQIYVTLPLLFFKGVWSESSYVALLIAQRLYNAGMTVQWISLKTVIPEVKQFSSGNVDKIFYFSFLLACVKIFITYVMAIYVLNLLFPQQSNDVLFYLKILSLSFIGAALYITYGYGVSILRSTESELKIHSFYLAVPAICIVWSASYYFEAIGFAVGIVAVRMINGLYFYRRYSRVRTII